MTLKALKSNELKLNKSGRIWEIDFLRGLLILLVVFDHFMFDMAVFVSKSSLSSDAGLALRHFAQAYLFNSRATGQNLLGHMRSYLHDFFVAMFCVISGISCAFSKNNLARGLKLAVAAIALSLAVWGLNFIEAVNLGGSINFNVLHVLALSILLYALLDKIKTPPWVLIVLTAAMILVGLEFWHYPAGKLGKWFFWVVDCADARVHSSLDYLPFLPYAGWFMSGALLSKILYKERTSLFPSAKTGVLKPVIWCGRYSLTVYIVSQIVMLFVLTALTEWLHWL